MYALLATLAAAPPALHAQSVGGRVIEEGSLQPVAYAAVALLDSADAVVANAVADNLGSFFVRVRAGHYRLRAAFPSNLSLSAPAESNEAKTRSDDAGHWRTASSSMRTALRCVSRVSHGTRSAASRAS